MERNSGIDKAISFFLVGCLVLGCIFGSMCSRSCSGAHDDTDPPGGVSGMSLFIDHRTGCQYLGLRGLYGAGGITPRLDGQGHHVGCRQ